MKQLFLILGFLFFTFSINAQIDLEHTFSTNTSINWFQTNTKGTMYFEDPDTISNQLKIYNEDYSLYKTVTIPRPIGYNIIIRNISEQLFNSDSSIEFSCSFARYSPTAITKIVIYDENATVIKDFGTYNFNVYPGLTDYNGGKTKLIIINNYSRPRIFEIYSLSGTMPSNVSELKMSNAQPPFPNPAKSIINLPYVLDKEQTTIMRIYKMNGQLIEQKQIDSTFDRIQLNVASYESGIYIYEYNGISKKFTVN